jgi:ATP-dependent Clp protease ATP-binding subunit ClpX
MNFKSMTLKSLLLSSIFNNCEISAARDDFGSSDNVFFVISHNGEDVIFNEVKNPRLQNSTLSNEASKFFMEAKKIFNDADTQLFLQNLNALLDAQDTNKMVATRSPVATELKEYTQKSKSPAEHSFLNAMLRKSAAYQTPQQSEAFLKQLLTIKKSLNGEAVENANVPQKLIPPSTIMKHLDDFVIGQTHPKKVLSVAMYNHYKRASLLNQNKKDIEISKSNVLLIGPSGSGKTLLAETLAKAQDVPFLMVDASQITATGYVGDSINDVMKRLLHAAGGDPKKAERAIVFIDELDKRKAGNTNGTVDVSGLCVQQELLKLIEGTKIQVSTGSNPMQSQTVEIDTSNILFVCGGAFVGLDRIMAERAGKLPYSLDDLDPQLPVRPTSEDLIRFGIIPELIGRLPIIAMLDDITEETLVRILKEPKNAITKQYQELFKMEGVELEFTDDALKAIAKRALDSKIGARGLRSILEETLLETMYLLPDASDIQKVTVTDRSILEGIAPNIEYTNEKKA